MVKVKICGITNLEDATVAVEAGADFLGFIFYPPSKRGVDINTAKEIVAHLRTVPHCPILVGVFVDETAVYMANVLDELNLDLAQLSGNEVPSLVGEPSSPIYGRCYKALKPTSYAEAEADLEWYLPPINGDRGLEIGDRGSPDSQLPTLLLDTYHPTLPGGTGELTDWEMGALLAQQTDGLLLAGGLNPDNVAEAVQQVRPFGVDVASGVEAEPGKKDHALVQAFIQNAKAA